MGISKGQVETLLSLRKRGTGNLPGQKRLFIWELEEIFIKNQQVDGFEIITLSAGTIKSFSTPKTHQLSLEKAEIYKISSGDKFFVQVGKI